MRTPQRTRLDRLEAQVPSPPAAEDLVDLAALLQRAGDRAGLEALARFTAELEDAGAAVSVADLVMSEHGRAVLSAVADAAGEAPCERPNAPG